MGWVIDSAGTPLDIADGTTYNVLSQDAPMPDVDAQYASSVDSPADRITSSRYKNRTISLKLIVVGSDAAGLNTALGALQRAVGKLNRDAIVDGDGVGGTLTYTSPTSTTVTFDVCKASVSAEMGWTHTHGTSTTADLVFECWPFGRGAENTPSDHTETTLPVLNFTESSVGGDVPALARLVVDEDQSKDQQSVIYGIRSRHYSADVTAGLLWQCEAMTPLGASAATAGSGFAGTASGSSTILADELTTTYQDLVKSTVAGSALTSVTGSNSTDTFTKSTHGMVNNAQVVLSAKTGGSGLSTTTTYYVIASATNTFQLALTPGGAAVDLGSDVSSVTVTPTTYWTHIGAYRVIVRAQPASTNTGVVSLRASWSQADVTNYTQGVAASCDAGNWTLVDLGVVSVPVVAAGTQRWELRIQGCSTVAGDDVFLDHIELFPVDECSGVAQVSLSPTTNTQTISDDFTRSSVSLDADTPSPQGDGNAWVESTATSFTVNGTAAQRTGVSDTSTGGLDAISDYGKFAVVGAAAAGQYAQTEFRLSSAGGPYTRGLIFRYTDTSNWAAAALDHDGYLYLFKCVSGTVSQIARQSTTLTSTNVSLYSIAVTLQAACYSNGRFDVTPYGNGAAYGYISSSDSVLATGGTLASGKVGIFDHYTGGTACTRTNTYFISGTSLTDAACFGGQSIQVASDSVVRSKAAGIWSRPGRFEGDFLTVPASGKESRPVEVLVKFSRAPLGASGDEGIDDISGKLYLTPRYLQLPA